MKQYSVAQLKHDVKDDIIQSCEDVSKKRSPAEAGRDSVDKEW